MGISVPTTQYVVEMCHLFKVSSDYMLGINNSITMNLDEFSDEELKLIYHGCVFNNCDNKKENRPHAKEKRFNFLNQFFG